MEKRYKRYKMNESEKTVSIKSDTNKSIFFYKKVTCKMIFT